MVMQRPTQHDIVGRQILDPGGWKPGRKARVGGGQPDN